MEKSKVLVEVNECDFGSTGTIAKNISEYSKSKGWKCYFCAFESKVNFLNCDFSFSLGKIYDFIMRCLCRIDGSDGFHCKKATRKFLKFLDKVHPTIIHIHNVHGHYINLPILFKYAKLRSIKIVWTMHDCWPLTGKCPYFDMVSCDKWRSLCKKCPSRLDYPGSFLMDCTTKYHKKKINLYRLYADILTLVTPSEWLKKVVSESRINFLNCKVINNGIAIPEPIDIDQINEIKQKYNIDDKKIVFFSAANPFSKRKGLDFITKLATSLDRKKYMFLVAGLNDSQIADTPNVTSVGIIKSRKQMNNFYYISDCFLNPTLEENFPTVNIESLMCGTPVITFKSGGSAEMINSRCGIAISRGNYDDLKKAVTGFEKGKFSFDECRTHSQKYTISKMCEQYLEIFENSLD